MPSSLKITPDLVNRHVDNLVHVIENIKRHHLTILVGQNGTGKSFIRKQLNARFIAEFNEHRNVVREISMQLRTETKSGIGMPAAMHDWPTDPTSLATWKLMQSAMGMTRFSMDRPYYLVLDEMEIGMSGESTEAMLQFLSGKIPEWLETTLGVMVITHSEKVAGHLYRQFDADFIDLGYGCVNYDIGKWQNREIIPGNFEWLAKWSGMLFDRINERSHPVRRGEGG